jgi:hypothetical protein
MATMDALTGTFTLSCPRHGTARVRLSAFHRIERLAGAVHPAVYRVEFDCGCGGEHPALVSHDVLDWAPLGLEGGGSFLNLMTARHDDLAEELAGIATARIRAGEWPWSFFCYPEDRPRPVCPSSFSLLAAGGSMVGVAVLCPVCGAVSINVVSRPVDVPFATTPVSASWRVFAPDSLRTWSNSGPSSTRPCSTSAGSGWNLERRVP